MEKASKRCPEKSFWAALDTHGAVLFHGFDPGAEGFYRFASRFNHAFLTAPFGDRKNAGDRNELQAVTLGQAGLGLHFGIRQQPAATRSAMAFLPQAGG